MISEFRGNADAMVTGEKMGGQIAETLTASHRLAWCLAACTFLVVGFGLIEWQVSFSIEALRDDLRLKAESVARAIPANQVRDFAFTPESKGSFDEVLLRDQLCSFAELMPEMFIYTVQEQGDELLFGPESLAEDDPIASAVGTVYEQAPEGLIQLYKTRESGVVGPYRDEYGEFLSGYAPVMDVGGEVYFMIGVDIRKHDMERSAWALRLSGYALLLIAVACIGAGYYLIGGRSQAPSRFNQHTETAMVVVLGLCVTILGVNLCNEAETVTRKRQFAQLANAAAEAVRDAQARIENYLERTVRFVEASDNVRPEDFAIFSTKFTETAATGDLMLLDTVSDAAAQERILVGLTTCTPPGLFCTGTDISSLLDWHGLLEVASQTDRAVSAKISTALSPLDVNFIAVQIIQDGPGRQGRDHAALVWNSEKILKSAKASLRSGAENMELVMLNIEADPEAFDVMKGETVRYHESRLAWHHPLVSMAQSHVLAATPTPLFYVRNPLRITPSIGIAGVALTVLAAALVSLMQRQNKVLHHRVARVTDNLLERERLLEAVMRLGLRFVNYPSDRIENGIQEALEEAGAVYGVDRAYVFAYNFERETFTNTHEWCRPGVGAVIGQLQDQPYSFLAENVELHRTHKPWGIEDVAALPEGELKKLLSAQNVKSLITVPLFLRGECVGFIGFDAVRTIRRWTEDEQIVLKILAELISNAMDRKLAEDTVEENKSRLKGLFVHSKDAIVFTDGQGVYLDVNPAACALTGRTREEMIGSHPRVDCDEFQPVKFESFWMELLNEGYADGVLKLRKPDGRKVVAEVHAVANILPDLHFMVLRDATERRNLQHQLEQSQRLDSLGRLASGVAHELNNVLSPILMGCDLVRAGNTNPQLTSTINIMEDSSRRGAAIIRQILTFARGSTEEARGLLDLREVVMDISNVIRQSLSRTIKVIIQSGPPLPKIEADRTGIEQVIMNLCINAKDAMNEKGTIAIDFKVTAVDETTASAHPEVMPGDFVELTVSDTGEGIPPAIRERIFEPFFTTKELGKGTGLGLSVLQGIVRTHHGFINLSSTLGIGTQFAIFLPVAKRSEE